MTTPEIEVSWEDDHDHEVFEVSELDRVKERLAHAEENLRMLSEGVRCVASQLMVSNQQNQMPSPAGHKRIQSTDSEDNATHATAEETLVSESLSFQECSSINKSNSLLSEHDSQLSEILSTERMAPMPAADLLALQNAAQMVKEHARLSSAEASIAVDDTIQAQRAARNWQSRALAAEAELKFAKKQVHHLSRQNQKLSHERKVLVKEVRKVHKELSTNKQQDLWGQLEGYVTQALSIHEHQLKQQPSLSPSPSITPSSSQYQQQQDNENKVAVDNENKPGPPIAAALGSIGNVLGFGPKSPPRTRARNDAPTTAKQSPKSIRGVDSMEEKMVSIDDKSSFGVSPVTFVESPQSSDSTRNLVDPHVLRSLALPAVNDC